MATVEVVKKYKAYFEQGGISADVEELKEKTLHCHCDRDDVLLNALQDIQKGSRVRRFLLRFRQGRGPWWSCQILEHPTKKKKMKGHERT